MTDSQRADPTLGALVHQLTTQVPDLIRSEIRLAQAEMTQKGTAWSARTRCRPRDRRSPSSRWTA